MDYCSWFPEGWWGDVCCKAHDEDYLNQIGQLLADDRLFACVANSANHPVLAAVSVGVAGIMWAGVRVFGKRFYKKAKQL